MKIKKSELLRLIDDKLRKLETERLARDKIKYDEYRDACQHYVNTKHSAWAEFAHTIQNLIKLREPIQHSAVPQELRSMFGLTFFETKEPKLLTPSTVETDLRNMRDFLHLVEDDEISTYALQKMGFSAANLFKK